MYDEDRQTALAMYERMFDETADEQGLLQLLVSPTRQAVVLARSYDAKLRKLQIESRSRDDNYMPDPEDVPSFIFIIDKTAQQAAELGVKEVAAVEGQFSIFDKVEMPLEEEKPEELSPEAQITEPVAEAAEVSIEETVEEAPLPEEAEVKATEDSLEQAVQSSIAGSAAPEEEENDGFSIDLNGTQEEEISDVEETANAVNAFLADFTVENGELVSSKAESADFAEAPSEPVKAEEAEKKPVKAAEAPTEYRRKTNILLLILYIFLAIPVTLAGIALLLIPTALALALAVGCAYLGVSSIGMCFGSFSVIADTMVVFGAGLILAALGLLFAWLFIWFIGGAIVGLIRGICKLGRKICCKEVAVQ